MLKEQQLWVLGRLIRVNRARGTEGTKKSFLSDILPPSWTILFIFYASRETNETERKERCSHVWGFDLRHSKGAEGIHGSVEL